MPLLYVSILNCGMLSDPQKFTTRMRPVHCYKTTESRMLNVEIQCTSIIFKGHSLTVLKNCWLDNYPSCFIYIHYSRVSFSRLFHTKIDPDLSAFDLSFFLTALCKNWSMSECFWLPVVGFCCGGSSLKHDGPLPEFHAATGRLTLMQPSPGVRGVFPGLGVWYYKFAFPTVSF